MKRRDHTKKIFRFPLQIELAAFIVVKQSPKGNAVNSYEKVPELMRRYCLTVAKNN